MRALLLLSAALLGGTATHAHEYVAKPMAMQARPGQEIALEVVSSHVFVRSQELEDAKDSHASLWADGKRTAAALQPDDKAMVHRGSVTAPRNPLM